MPLLAGLIGSGFASFVGFLAAIMTKRAAVAVALSAFIVGGWVALQIGMYAIWVALAYVVPVSLYNALGVVLYLLPTNTDACFGALVVGRIGVWLWQEQKAHAKAISFIT